MEEIVAPVEVGTLSHYFQGLYIPGGAGFLPSTGLKIVLYGLANLYPIFIFRKKKVFDGYFF